MQQSDAHHSPAENVWSLPVTCPLVLEVHHQRVWSFQGLQCQGFGDLNYLRRLAARELEPQRWTMQGYLPIPFQYILISNLCFVL
jgi:hypothetical protein